MKWALGMTVLLGCVADVPEPVSPPNPIPPDEHRDDGAGGGGEAPTSQTDVTATGYLKAIANVHCVQAFACRATYPGDSAAFEASWQDSVADCAANLEVAWGVPTIETEIAKGRIDYDGTAAVQCLAGVAFAGCNTHWTDGIQWAESCYDVMVGNVPTGASCDSLYSCQSYDCDTTQHVCL